MATNGLVQLYQYNGVPLQKKVGLLQAISS